MRIMTMITTASTAHISDLTLPMQIGGLNCRNRVFLAPMSGITDVAFRKIAWKLGAGLVFSEMVASEALVTGKQEMAMKAQSAGLPIHAVQIAGRQAHWMGLAAKMAEDNGADLIDINMGCPSRRVTTGYSGSALMRDLDHALGLIESVVDAVDVPVTLKMRLGWDHSSINAPELAKRAQSAGIQMITVHGRTRCQFYKGSADWNAVAEVRAQTNLPMVVNGDIDGCETAEQALQQSKADAVMLGRACYGAPWLPGQIARGKHDDYSNSKLCALILEHFDETLTHYGQYSGVRQFRKHLSWYIDGRADLVVHNAVRKKLMTSNNANEIVEMIGQVFGRENVMVAA